MIASYLNTIDTNFIVDFKTKNLRSRIMILRTWHHKVTQNKYHRMLLPSRQNVTISVKKSASGIRERKRSDKCLPWSWPESGRLPHIFLIAFNGPDILGSLSSIILGLKKAMVDKKCTLWVKEEGDLDARLQRLNTSTFN